jgi:glycosyltransferase involved in cell wall biosynthesis
MDYFKQHTGLPDHKLSILHNGIAWPTDPPDKAESRQHLGLDSNQRVIGFVGRMSAGKGLDYFIDFACRALELNPGQCFVLIGDGPERAKAKALVRARGQDKKILFLGQKPDMDWCYPALDLLLFTSEPWAEGMPGVVLEACAHCLPILARHSAPIEEISSYYPRIMFIDSSLSANKQIDDALGMPNYDLRAFKDEFEVKKMAENTLRLYSLVGAQKKGNGL